MPHLNIQIEPTDQVSGTDYLPRSSHQGPFSWVDLGGIRFLIYPGAEETAERFGAELIARARAVRGATRQESHEAGTTPDTWAAR